MTEDEKSRLKARLKDYLEKVTEASPRAGAGMYVCPLCGSGKGEHGTGALKLYTETDTFSCYSCHIGGDIFNLVAALHNLDGKRDFNKAGEIIREALSMSSTDYTHTTQHKPLPPKPAQPKQEQPKADYSRYIEACCKAVKDTDYLAKRGLTPETVKRFRLGYDAEKQRVIIPYDRQGSYYIGRSTAVAVDGKGGSKHYKPKKEDAGEEPVYNAAAIANAAEAQQPIFICEAPLDAISVMQAGGTAVSIGGTGVNKLKECLDGIQGVLPAFIIATDADSAGDKAAEQLQAILTAKDARYTRLKLDAHKDANAFLTADAAAFTAAVQQAIETALETPKDSYNKTSAAAQLDSFVDFWDSDSASAISTGFKELDGIICGGLCPASLYVIGAVSSMGKTTFCLQVADNVAAAGNDVLYFALEQPASVLAAKSLSRLTLDLSPKCTGVETPQAYARTADSLVNPDKRKEWKKSKSAVKVVNAAIAEYKKYAGNIFFVGRRRLNARDIQERVAQHIQLRGKKPVVFIDFLQLLAGSSDRLTERQIIDENLLILKDICESFAVPVVAISSFNRASYNSNVDMSAFKESGAIEYSAEVVIALQPKGLDTGKDAEAKNKQLMKDIKTQSTRAVEATVLKNRIGSVKSAYFEYNAMFNSFEEKQEDQPPATGNADKKGKTSLNSLGKKGY